ncbi:hypothetical protein C8Q79DRAFT_553190 [Trametes meyenii]|nr:hypothetical protein C8Q79DRAFT_553190 [Trametes meyenii]
MLAVFPPSSYCALAHTTTKRRQDKLYAVALASSPHPGTPSVPRCSARPKNLRRMLNRDENGDRRVDLGICYSGTEPAGRNMGGHSDHMLSRAVSNTRMGTHGHRIHRSVGIFLSKHRTITASLLTHFHARLRNAYSIFNGASKPSTTNDSPASHAPAMQFLRVRHFTTNFMTFRTVNTSCLTRTSGRRAATRQGYQVLCGAKRQKYMRHRFGSPSAPLSAL